MLIRDSLLVLRSLVAAGFRVVVSSESAGNGNRNWRTRVSYGIFAHVPCKIRQLVTALEQAGFVNVPGGKGSHRKFRHLRLPGSLILSGESGDDAKHYQEKQVRDAIRKARK